MSLIPARLDSDGDPPDAVPLGPRRRAPWGRIAVVVAAAVIGFGAVVGVRAIDSNSSSTASTAAPAPSGSGASATDAALLRGLVVQQGDVATGSNVELIAGGNRVDGQPTLDLCNGTYASETLRTTRVQVAVVDSGGATVLSTEAVLYRNPAATTQAFAELEAAAKGCPAKPVVSPVGEPTMTTTFGARPDAAWPSNGAVRRLAYQFTSVDPTGQSNKSVAVYLARGRLLMGVYFGSPAGAQGPIAGESTVAGIVELMTTRIARVPAAAVAG